MLRFSILTISDTRTPITDKSGAYLLESLNKDGFSCVDRIIVGDNLYQVRAKVSQWIANPEVDVILTTGGTGLTERDVTPEAVKPLLDKEIVGFGELFRLISRDEVGTATMQSRCLGGVANKTYVFCLPGSTSACKTAWEGLLQAQFSEETKPCNFIDIRDRL